MNRIMKYAAAALVAATAVSTLGGCEQLEKKAPEDTVAVSFGDTNIMLDEVTYMIRSMEYTYESYFGSPCRVHGFADLFWIKHLRQRYGRWFRHDSR